MSDSEEEQVISEEELEVSEDKKEEGDYLNALKSLERKFTAHCFESALTDAKLSEKEFSYFSAPVTRHTACTNNYQKKSNIIEISKEGLYELVENGEFSTFFNILESKDQHDVLSKLYSAKKHKASPDFSYKEMDDETIVENQPQSNEAKTLQQMFQKYAPHTVIQALGDKEKWDDLFSHLDDDTLYVPNYTCKKYEAELKGSHLLLED